MNPAVAEAIKWRDSWRGRMLRKYAGKWIAIRGRKVVAVARTYEALDDKLETLKPGPVHVCKEEAPVVVVY